MQQVLKMMLTDGGQVISMVISMVCLTISTNGKSGRETIIPLPICMPMVLQELLVKTLLLPEAMLRKERRVEVVS